MLMDPMTVHGSCACTRRCLCAAIAAYIMNHLHCITMRACCLRGRIYCWPARRAAQPRRTRRAAAAAEFGVASSFEILRNRRDIRRQPDARICIVVSANPRQRPRVPTSLSSAAQRARWPGGRAAAMRGQTSSPLSTASSCVLMVACAARLARRSNAFSVRPG